MDKEKIKKVLEELNKEKKRKFSQSYDLIINLKDFDIKSNPINFFATLHYQRGKKVSTCALVGQGLADKAKGVCDFVVSEKDFAKYKDDKKEVQNLAKKYDFFIAQANLMAQVATVFGKVLGPKGKMPNPKAGCVVPPGADMKGVVDKLQKMVKLQTKNAPIIQCIAGNETMPEEEVIDNILSIYSALIKQLPNEANNVKEVLIKKTMSKPMKV